MTIESNGLFDEKGRPLRVVLFNTAKDGTGTWYCGLVDSDGKLLIGSIGAGTAVVGKVLPARSIVETQFTGTGSMVVATAKIAPGVAYKVVAIELHLNAAVAIGTQNLVLTLDNGTGSAYDINILTIDMVANAVTDLIVTPADLLCKSTDVITAAWDNNGSKTYGLTFKHELIS